MELSSTFSSSVEESELSGQSGCMGWIVSTNGSSAVVVGTNVASFARACLFPTVFLTLLAWGGVITLLTAELVCLPLVVGQHGHFDAVSVNLRFGFIWNNVRKCR